MLTVSGLWANYRLPVVFGASLLIYAVGFYNRRAFFPEDSEDLRRQSIENRRKRQEIRAAFERAKQDENLVRDAQEVRETISQR